MSIYYKFYSIKNRNMLLLVHKFNNTSMIKVLTSDYIHFRYCWLLSRSKRLNWPLEMLQKVSNIALNMYSTCAMLFYRMRMTNSSNIFTGCTILHCQRRLCNHFASILNLAYKWLICHNYNRWIYSCKRFLKRKIRH